MKCGSSADLRKSGFHFSHARQTGGMKLPSWFWLPVITLALAGCSLFGPKKADSPAETPETAAPKLVGRIASIPADKRFVLIQSYGSWKIEPGTILTTRGPDESTANLLVTGESLGHFAAADLQSGTVEIGDAVYSQHIPKPPSAPADIQTVPELPENQQKVETEKVQKNN